MTGKYILGNWKMHGTGAQGAALARAVAACTPAHGTVVAVFPPFTLLPSVADSLRNTPVKLGAQDCSPEKEGAFTGDVSASMLFEAGCLYVIVGHSERRAGCSETSALVKRKAESAISAGLTPVICVGESLAEREAGKHLDCVAKQLEESLPSVGSSGSYLIAYEPVWAIGSGRTPTTAEITQMHKTIASRAGYATSGARTGIVYGGSVKAANARDILTTDGVDGVLVGGASLKADEFCAILAASS